MQEITLSTCETTGLASLFAMGHASCQTRLDHYVFAPNLGKPTGSRRFKFTCAVTRAVRLCVTIHADNCLILQHVTYDISEVKLRSAHAGLGSTGQMLPFCKANRAILHSNLQPHARLRVH